MRAKANAGHARECERRRAAGRRLLAQAGRHPDGLLTPPPRLAREELRALAEDLIRRGWAERVEIVGAPHRERDVWPSAGGAEGFLLRAVGSEGDGRGAKREAVLAMLREGATVAELADRLSWRPHTVRGFLSRLRRGGLPVQAEPAGEGDVRRKRYRFGFAEAGPG